MFDKDHILRTHPLLSVLPSAVLDRLVSRSSIEFQPKGTVVFKEGESCNALYMVLSGRCEARRSHPSGIEKTVEIYGPGDVFGDTSFSCPGPHRDTVRVITDSVFQRIDSADVQSLLADHLTTVDGAALTDRPAPVLTRETTAARTPGRIVTLASLSQQIPDRLIAESLSLHLRDATGASVLLVELGALEGVISLSEWASVQTAGGGEFRLSEFLPQEERGYHRLNVRLTGAPHESAFIAPLISHFGRHFPYVFLRIHMNQLSMRPAMECMIQSDQTFLLLQPTAGNHARYQQVVKEVRTQMHGDCSDLKPIVCLAHDERAHGFNELFKPAHVHAFIHDCPIVEDANIVTPLEGRSDQFKSDLRRLAREIGRCRIGLALSSGGAKGLAHIGVIQVLEENGIEVDVVAGCSMGSYVAAVWACGFNGKEMERLARELESRWGLWKILDPAVPPRRGFMIGGAVRNRLKRSIGDARFSDTVRPLRIVATNLDTLERVVFSRGEVAAAVHASSAIPGVCVPVEIDGETYIDGGVSDPLPIDVLSEMGVEKIIAVNTIPTPSFLRCSREMEREQAALRGKSPPLLEMLNRHFNYFARGNILDIMMRAVHGAQIRVAEEACRHADVLLRPLAIDARWHDFTHPAKYIELGRKVAEENLEAIKALVKTRDKERELSITQNRLAVVA